MQGSENAQMLIVKRTGEPVPSSKIHTASSRRVHVHVCVHVCVCVCVHVGMCAAVIHLHLSLSVSRCACWHVCGSHTASSR